MLFVYGTAILVLAIVLLGAAKFFVTRHESSSWVSRFAGTETMALTITTMSAFGVAFLCAGLASNAGSLGATELGASLGVIALAIVGVVRIFRIADRKAARKHGTKTSAATGTVRPAA